MTFRAVRHGRAGSVGHRFCDALTSDGLSIIAEIKRRSPSRDDLCPDADAASFARIYEGAGAACLSVLTDQERFGGSPSDLHEARSAVSIPILRKDFLSTEQDVHETYEMGADALLLIVADIGVENLRPLQDLALSLGIDVLTEVRTERELNAAVKHGAYMIAVNQRDDPKDPKFTVNPEKAVSMSRAFDKHDAGIVRVAASGIGVPNGTTREAIADAGYDAALIGEALITADDPAARLRELIQQRTPVAV